MVLILAWLMAEEALPQIYATLCKPEFISFTAKALVKLGLVKSRF